MGINPPQVKQTIVMRYIIYIFSIFRSEERYIFCVILSCTQKLEGGDRAGDKALHRVSRDSQSCRKDACYGYRGSSDTLGVCSIALVGVNFRSCLARRLSYQ